MAVISKETKLEILQKLNDGTYERKNPVTNMNNVIIEDTIYIGIRYKFIVVEGRPFLEVISDE